MRNWKHIFGLFLFATLVLSGCKKGTSLSETDFKDMYSSKSDVPQPRFKVYHPDHKKTTIYFMFDNRGLTYGPNPRTGTRMSNVKISWQLYTDYSSTEIVDSASFMMIDTVATSGFSQLQGSFDINIPYGADYILKVTTMDLQSEQQTISFLNILKSNNTNRQFYLVKLKENNSVLFRNYFYSQEEIEIIYAEDKSITELEGKYFRTIFPISAPPYSMASPKPFDFSNFTPFTLEMKNGVGTLTGKELGIYHIGKKNGARNSGLTLFQYNNDFPEINTVDEMISPLRFITSRKEFSKINKYQDPKKALDEFWKNTTTDREKSRRLIKGYYNRVQNANYFFSSFKEGWKTDRGVIYIVFGPPSIVYRSLTGESWTYGEESDYRSLTFNFVKINNPFTNNDYTLQRTSMYKSPWYRAVDAWRQGKVASLEY